jgi:hypothetical protein
MPFFLFISLDVPQGGTMNREEVWRECPATSKCARLGVKASRKTMKSKTYRILHVIDSFGLGDAGGPLNLPICRPTRFAPECVFAGRGPY